MNANVTLRVNEVGSNGDFWDTMQRQRYDLPERYLLLAVLKDALLSYRKALRRRGKCRCVERAWFFDDDTDRLFSFESVCAALGLSPARIRGHLLLWERHTSRLVSPPSGWLPSVIAVMPAGRRWRHQGSSMKSS